MKLVEEFWRVIGVYNTTMLWIQFILVGFLLLFTVIAYWKKTNCVQIILKIVLACCFSFIGIVFFIICDCSALGRFVGFPIYTGIAILFIIDIWWNRIELCFPKQRKSQIFTGFLFFLYLIYPLVSYLFGHKYPETVLYLMPCPLVYFTIVVLSSNIKKINLPIYCLLIFWGLTGLPKAIFGAYEDLILFFGGIYGLLIIIRNFNEIVIHNSKKHSFSDNTV